MKKIALFLVLALVVSVLASASAFAPADILGTWYLGSFEYNTATAGILGDYRLELSRDRSAVLVLGGEEKQGSWELTDSGATVVIDDSSSYFTLEDGSLKASLVIGDDYSHDCVFVREQPAAVEIPEAVEAAGEDEYFGTYAITLQKIGDIVIPMENGEEILTAKIEFAQVTVSGSALSVSDGVSEMSDYKDGKVVIPAGNLVSGASSDTLLVIAKTNSGIMATCDVAPEMAYYLSPVDAPEASETSETVGAGK